MQPTIAILTCPEFLDHDNGVHPETPLRLERILAARQAATDLAPFLTDVPFAAATRAEMELVHSPPYLDWLDMLDGRTQAAGQRTQLDIYTHMSGATMRAARLAAGAGITAVKQLVTTKTNAAFAWVRPPGHHALADTTMGFCLINNAGLAARYCRHVLGLKRVMVVDVDVHHGNGTQQMFWDDPSILLASMQRYPQWPYSGWFGEIGGGDGRGYNVNCPLPKDSGNTAHLRMIKEVIAPMAMEFAPQIIIVSAGYDSHVLDPLGGMAVTTGGFGEIFRELTEIASALKVKIAAFLEGGYNPDALAESVMESLRALCGLPGHAPASTDLASPSAAAHIDATRRHLATYWRSLRAGAT